MVLQLGGVAVGAAGALAHAVVNKCRKKHIPNDNVGLTIFLVPTVVGGTLEKLVPVVASAAFAALFIVGLLTSSTSVIAIGAIGFGSIAALSILIGFGVLSLSALYICVTKCQENNERRKYYL